ncbi:cytochrome C biogenesis protein [Marinomonas piezotolerans]|uniref:Cytochrome C biogenesis protein n=1 Tax=Marinomonas piezotolerans TaxID=2213058 RepID=A0A370UE91_9GAMM|nr:protein-disulfide reductase DsbD [Marinomonas piezotolerans]RDL46106.1 cytochrome C biogenesis protein [Marinomonas piezotolerans]
MKHWLITMKSFYLLIWMFVSVVASAGEFLKPDQAFVLSSTPDGVLEWQISPHYYLYKDRIRVSEVGQKRDLHLMWLSQAEQKDDPNFGLVEVFHDQVRVKVTDTKASGAPTAYEVTYQGCSEQGLCYPPQQRTVTLSLTNEQAVTQPSPTTKEQGLVSGLMNNGVWVTLLTFFALGLGLSLTPCVLPMVPILAGVIAGQSGKLSSKKGFVLALSYVLGMSVTYTIAGVLVGIFGAQLNLQAAMQNPWILAFFALVFVLLSLSMFGLYELQLPDRLRNKMDALGSNRKGGQLFGVAIMGAISALVVSPCVSAPLAGALLYISTTGDAWLGGAVLFVLSIGMGGPLLIMGLGGGRFLPKAGMWMQHVKAFFGVVLLGVSISLLGRFLPEYVSTMMWALLLLAYGCYIIPNTLSGKWRRMQLAGSIALLFYSLSIGSSSLAGSPSLMTPLKFFGTATSNEDEGQQSALFTRYDSVLDVQNQIARANADGLPVVLDLYADWCTACKTMEKEVFDKASLHSQADRYQFIQLDITDNTSKHHAFMESLGIFGPPAIVFFNSDGTLSDVTQGELSEREMLEHLDKLR